MATLFNDYTHAKRGTLSPEQDDMVRGCMNLARSVARKLCPPDDNRQRREQRVEEIEGEAMLALVELACTFDAAGKTQFSTTAHKYVTLRVRRVIDAQRLASMQATGVEWSEHASPEPGDDGECEACAGSVLDDFDRELLGRLPGAMREHVRLVILDGLTPDQVALQLGVEVKDVKLSIRNACRILAVEREKLNRPALFDEAE